MFNLIFYALARFLNAVLYVFYTVQKAVGGAVLSALGSFNLANLITSNDFANTVLGYFGYLLDANVLRWFIPFYITVLAFVFVLKRVLTFIQLY